MKGGILWWFGSCQFTTKFQHISRYLYGQSNKDRLRKFLDEIENHDNVKLIHNEGKKDVPTIPTEMKRTQSFVRHKLEQLEVQQLIEFLHGMNAVNPCVLDVRGKSSFADYLIISSGRNSSHISFMTRKLAKEIAAISPGHRRPLVYGRERSDWIAVDIDRIVVHCMLQETREWYQIEQLWLDETNEDSQ
ncbi:Ribosomal silencing factor RsfS [Galdieria sulphuraria]|uniref:Ribosomal silencing factor RsfS n=1 Tax=Galdieria sulphuraria TaxID=130081 RepID=M2Y660_GALSU|nr:uncharacterized protein Gasu_11760 [Galdieria sulphuraria]EME31498.1 hypothetical protein Gasu_11760 [Galdieria sulphuraria]GJD10247.1 Ribosomal silencing factor RsfS [Galdieria sulphuraria]|eukprot:XP_005708018.1 hypothetical protein Gasu_11760 [Galdieria sulphuraria]